MDFEPAYFVGAGAFFALMVYVAKPEAIGKVVWYVSLGTPIMVACVPGVIYGWITVTVREPYEKKVAAKRCGMRMRRSRAGWRRSLAGRCSDCGNPRAVDW